MLIPLVAKRLEAPKKTQLKPHLKTQWYIPSKYSREFVARMEDILETYALPYDKEIPLVCMDEQPCQLLDHHLEPLPMRPASPRKEDYEYVRKGTCSIFVFTEPLQGWRHVCARERRIKVDWALMICELLKVYYPSAKRIRFVMDNLSTHTIASLYEAFSPVKALELAKRLEIHYTPKHGSGLNIAEIELNVMTIQCLDRRIPSLDALNVQLSAWETVRNAVPKLLIGTSQLNKQAINSNGYTLNYNPVKTLVKASSANTSMPTMSTMTPTSARTAICCTTPPQTGKATANTSARAISAQVVHTALAAPKSPT